MRLLALFAISLTMVSTSALSQELELGATTSERSLSKHLFRALEDYAETDMGANVVLFGSANQFSTELSIDSGGYSIDCSRHLKDADTHEYNCTVAKPLLNLRPEVDCTEFARKVGLSVFNLNYPKLKQSSLDLTHAKRIKDTPSYRVSVDGMNFETKMVVDTGVYPGGNCMLKGVRDYEAFD